MTNMTDPPICVLLAICNDVIEDKQTNNKSLINLFNGAAVLGLPSMQPQMAFVASITNFKGTVPVQFVLESPSGAKVLTVNAEAKSDNPLVVVDVAIKLAGFPILEYGTYQLFLYAEGKHLLSRNFTVMKANIQGSTKQ
jgi:hypothetical protein